jgi:hypothetical protein
MVSVFVDGLMPCPEHFFPKTCATLGIVLLQLLTCGAG